MLERGAVYEELSGHDVGLYEFAYGRPEVQWSGQVLPYLVFDKNQRVSQSVVPDRHGS
jgi:hypothetical protein